MPCIYRYGQTLLILVIFSGLYPAEGQQINIREFKYANSQGSLQMIKDQKGYIWSWSNNTIYRLTPYRAEQVGSTGEYPFFTGNRRLRFFEDKKGQIWILYGDQIEVDKGYGFQVKRLDILDPMQKSIVPIETRFQTSLPFNSKSVYSINRDSSGQLWISTNDGQLFTYDGQFSRQFPTTIDRKIEFVAPASPNSFWLVSSGKITEVDKTGTVVDHNPFPGLNSFFSLNLDGSFWAYRHDENGQGAVFLINRKHKPIKYALPATFNLNQKSKFIFEQQKRIWLIQPDFLGLWMLTTGQVIDLTDRIYPQINGFINIFQLYSFGENVVWLNANNWQYIIELQPIRFRQYLEGSNYSLRGITSFQDSMLWINSYKGIRIMNRFTGRLHKPLSRGIRYQGSFIPHIFGMGVVFDQQNRIWSGMEGNYVYQNNFSAKHPVSYVLPPYSIKRSPKVPFIDRDNVVWMGLDLGLVYYSPGDNAFVEFERYNDYNQLRESFIQGITETKEGLWLATDQGLYLLQMEEGVIAHYNQFPFNNIVHIYPDDNGIFWLSTRGEGVIRWNRSTGDMLTIKLGEGIAENYVHAVYEDDFGYLWLPTNNGLKRMEKRSLEIQSYYQEDGLTNNEFNYLSHYQAPDGQLYFGGVDGLVSFYPRDFLDEPPNRNPLHAHSFRILNDQGEWEDKSTTIGKQQKLVLAANVKAFSLSVELLEYGTPQPISYAYQLEGYDDGWQYTEDHKLQYNRLPYGRYTLQIKGKGRNDKWSVNRLIIPVEVLRPIYLQTWFLALCLTLLGLMIFGIYSWRVYALNQAKIHLEKKVAERTAELEVLNQTKDRLFAILGHELRGPLVYFQNIARNVAYLLQKKDYNRIEQMGEAIEKSANNLNELLDNLLNWGLVQTLGIPHHPEQLLLGEIGEQIIQIFTPISRSKGIELFAEFDHGARLFADKNAIHTILRNLLSNALKFTPPGGQVQLRIKKKLEQVLLVVEDNGIGMSEGQLKQLLEEVGRSTLGTEGEKGTGLGFHLCRELVRQNDGTIQVNSKPGKGTTIILNFTWQAATKNKPTLEKIKFN